MLSQRSRSAGWLLLYRIAEAANMGSALVLESLP